MDAIGGRLGEQYKEFNSGYGVNVVPLRQQFAGEIRLALLVLMGAVGFVLLIACANVANLQLSSGASRQRDRRARRWARDMASCAAIADRVCCWQPPESSRILLAWWERRYWSALDPRSSAIFRV
jgi:hypothetical protein